MSLKDSIFSPIDAANVGYLSHEPNCSLVYCGDVQFSGTIHWFTSSHINYVHDIYGTKCQSLKLSGNLSWDVHRRDFTGRRYACV